MAKEELTCILKMNFIINEADFVNNFDQLN